MDYKTVMVGLALDRPNDACLRVAGRRHRETMSELEGEFRASVERRATAVEWRSARSLPVPYLLQQARAADILVIGARPETLVDPSAAPDPSDLVMQAGRPLTGCRQGSHNCRNSRAGRVPAEALPMLPT